jgi:hypothetical protein
MEQVSYGNENNDNFAIYKIKFLYGTLSIAEMAFA